MKVVCKSCGKLKKVDDRMIDWVISVRCDTCGAKSKCFKDGFVELVK